MSTINFGIRNRRLDETPLPPRTSHKVPHVAPNARIVNAPNEPLSRAQRTAERNMRSQSAASSVPIAVFNEPPPPFFAAQQQALAVADFDVRAFAQDCQKNHEILVGRVMSLERAIAHLQSAVASHSVASMTLAPNDFASIPPQPGRLGIPPPVVIDEPVRAPMSDAEYQRTLAERSQNMLIARARSAGSVPAVTELFSKMNDPNFNADLPKIKILEESIAMEETIAELPPPPAVHEDGSSEPVVTVVSPTIIPPLAVPRSKPITLKRRGA